MMKIMMMVMKMMIVVLVITKLMIDVHLDAVHYEGRRVVGGLDDAAGQPGALAHQLGGAAVTNQG